MRAYQLFEEGTEFGYLPSEYTYRALVEALCQEMDLYKARKVLESMLKKEGGDRTRIYNIYLRALCLLNSATELLNVLVSMLQTECQPDVITLNIVINGFCKMGRIDEALKMLNDMTTGKFCAPDAVTFTTIIGGLLNVGRTHEALNLFHQVMRENGISPGVVTYNAVLRGLFKLQLADEAMRVFRRMLADGVAANSNTYSIIIDGLCSSDQIDEAKKFWDNVRNFGALAARSLNSYLSLSFPLRCSIRTVRMENNNNGNLKVGDDVSRGAFIVLEGLDRSGKTSQCSKLLPYLEGLGHPTELWRFPDRSTSIGQMISAYLSNQSQLDDHTIHLLYSANRWEKSSLMETKLKSGTTLIVDRYSYSGVAFSSAKGLDFEWCKAPEIGLLAPDLVLYLDITPEKAAERGGYGGERYEKLEFQKKVAESYRALRDPSWKRLKLAAGFYLEDKFSAYEDNS
ncbi:hypothetical protein GH714_022583 [Hevea brasiliensis]|uniref:Thymidylate kinase n=1 Tax=Hevea brasiliensis TaxID=3981 RepID=A0A6A6MVA6_HEVBR|nr:hypothetical protein GH714_022583 [Hevea brasiliensis]